MKPLSFISFERVNLARLQAVDPIFDSFSLPGEASLQEAILDNQSELKVTLPPGATTLTLQNLDRKSELFIRPISRSPLRNRTEHARASLRAESLEKPTKQLFHQEP
jgi:hypothetical protein